MKKPRTRRNSFFLRVLLISARLTRAMGDSSCRPLPGSPERWRWVVGGLLAAQHARDALVVGLVDVPGLAELPLRVLRLLREVVAQVGALELDPAGPVRLEALR